MHEDFYNVHHLFGNKLRPAYDKTDITFLSKMQIFVLMEVSEEFQILFI